MCGAEHLVADTIAAGIVVVSGSGGSGLSLVSGAIAVVAIIAGVATLTIKR